MGAAGLRPRVDQQIGLQLALPIKTKVSWSPGVTRCCIHAEDAIDRFVGADDRRISAVAGRIITRAEAYPSMATPLEQGEVRPLAR